MGKRKWTNIEAVEHELIALRAAGKTRQETADALGLTKSRVKNWISRYKRKQAEIKRGNLPKRRGRPKQKAVSGLKELEKEKARLQMENDLLRTFLEITGRGGGRG